MARKLNEWTPYEDKDAPSLSVQSRARIGRIAFLHSFPAVSYPQGDLPVDRDLVLLAERKKEV